MSIIRSRRPDSNFTIIENGIIYNENLDWRELGLLVFLLSKPDNWTVSMAHLAKQKESGLSSIKASIKKLRVAGYVTSQRQSDGTFDWFVFDSPQGVNNENKEDKSASNHAISPYVEKPHVEKPHVAKRTLIRTDKTITTETKVSNEFLAEWV